MRRKMMGIMLAAVLILTLLPTSVLAEDISPVDGYNDHDYDAIQAFLETEYDGMKNGLRVNASYDKDDPATWGVTWVLAFGEQYAQRIDWNGTGIGGDLDLSGCIELERLECRNNALTFLDVGGGTQFNCYIDCSDNALTDIDVTGSPDIYYMDCGDNRLETLDFSEITNLAYLICEDNELESIDIAANTNLWQLNCGGNPLDAIDVSANTKLKALSINDAAFTVLDLSANTNLESLYCNDTDLMVLDLSANTKLLSLECRGTPLSTLDLSANTQLRSLDCRDSQLATLDICVNTALERIESAGNPLTRIHANINSADIRLYADDGGYVSLYYIIGTYLYGSAEAVSPGVFMNWSDASGAEVATDADFVLTSGVAYELTANFLSLSGSPADGKIDTGEEITLTPNVAGGTWGFDEDCLARKGNVFTGLKAGVTTVTYTIGEASVSFDVTVSQRRLTLTSSVASGKIYTGGRITLTPNIDGGQWDWDKDYFSATFNSPATFKALKAGTTTITYTAEGQTVAYVVKIRKSALPQTGQDFTWVWLLSGTALMLVGAGAITLKRKAAKQ